MMETNLDKIEVRTTAKGEIVAEVRIGPKESLMNDGELDAVLDKQVQAWKGLKARFSGVKVVVEDARTH